LDPPRRSPPDLLHGIPKGLALAESRDGQATTQELGPQSRSPAASRGWKISWGVMVRGNVIMHRNSHLPQRRPASATLGKSPRLHHEEGARPREKHYNHQAPQAVLHGSY